MSSPGHVDGKDAVLDALIANRWQLVSIAARITYCRHLAEDVVQDAALKACHLPCERCIASPIDFARAIVRNLAIDRVRRCALERLHAAPEGLAENVEAPCTDPQAELESRERLRIVQGALDELPERTRRVFTLSRVEGVAQKSIAETIGVSPTLVSFMVHDAHERCLERLESYERG